MDTDNIITQPVDYVKYNYADIVKAAQKKLKRIIEQDGDLGGERRTPEYLKQLIAEEITQRAAIDFCMAHYRGERNGYTR